MRKVADSNYLQSDRLRDYLSKSAKNYVVLTDYTAVEAYKGRDRACGGRRQGPEDRARHAEQLLPQVSLDQDAEREPERDLRRDRGEHAGLPHALARQQAVAGR